MNISEVEIKKYCTNKKIFIGFSGGPDSRVLLDIFEKIFGTKIILLHFNHNYRKESYIEEENIKKEFSRFEMFFGKYEGKPGEKQRREARYNFFYTIMNRFSNSILVLGHNLDDRIETSLLNSLGGSGIVGFLNMKKISTHYLLENIKVYRPLIDIPKVEILKYANKRNLDYFIDNSNFDEKTSLRNYIRKNIVIPGQKQNKNFLEQWKKNYKLLEKININSFSFQEIKLPKILDQKGIKIKKTTFPQNLFETYILMKDLEFGHSINKENVNILFSIIKNKRGMFEIKNNFIYVNSFGLYFGNTNISKLLKISQQKIESEIFAKYKDVDNIKYRYTQIGDKYKSKTVSKRAINKKIPIFLRKFIVVGEKEGKIVYIDMPYEY